MDKKDNPCLNVVILAIPTRVCHLSRIIMHCTTSNYKEVSLTNVQMTNPYRENQPNFRSNTGKKCRRVDPGIIDMSEINVLPIRIIINAVNYVSVEAITMFEVFATFDYHPCCGKIVITVLVDDTEFQNYY